MSAPENNMESYPPLLGFGRGRRIRPPPGEALVRQVRSGTGRSRAITKHQEDMDTRPSSSRQDVMSEHYRNTSGSSSQGTSYSPGTDRDSPGGARPKYARQRIENVTMNYRSSSEAKPDRTPRILWTRRGDTRHIVAPTPERSRTERRISEDDDNYEEVRAKRIRKYHDNRRSPPYQTPDQVRTSTSSQRTTSDHRSEGRRHFRRVSGNEVPSNRDYRYFPNDTQSTPAVSTRSPRNEDITPQSKGHSRLITNGYSRNHSEVEAHNNTVNNRDFHNSARGRVTRQLNRAARGYTPSWNHVRDVGDEPLTVGMATTTKPASIIAQGTAPPQPYFSVAGRYADFEPNLLDPLPRLHQRIQNVSAAGSTIEGVEWKGTVNPLRGGFEIQMVGTMPVSGTTTGPHGADVYGCPSLGCEVTRTVENNIYGHWVAKHCYSSNVYWCDGHDCELYFLRQTAAKEHRDKFHPDEIITKEIGTAKLILKDGDKDVTLWRMNSRFNIAPGQTREALAKIVRLNGGIMESRLAALLRKSGFLVPLDRVCPPQRPDGMDDDISVESATASLWQSHVATSDTDEPSSAAGAPPVAQSGPYLLDMTEEVDMKEVISTILPRPTSITQPPLVVVTSTTPDVQTTSELTVETAPEVGVHSARSIPTVQIVYLSTPIVQETNETIVIAPEDKPMLDLAPAEDELSMPPEVTNDALIIQMEVGQEDMEMFQNPEDDDTIILSSEAGSGPEMDPVRAPSQRMNVQTVIPLRRTDDTELTPHMEVQEDPEVVPASNDTLPLQEVEVNDAETEAQLSVCSDVDQYDLDLYVDAADRGYQEGADGLDILLDYGYPAEHVHHFDDSGYSNNDVRVATEEPRWDSRARLNQQIEDYRRMVPVSLQVHPAGPRYWIDKGSAESYVSRLDTFRTPLIEYMQQALDLIGDTRAWANPMIALQPAIAQQRALRDTHNLIGTVLQAMDTSLSRAALIATEHQEEAYRTQLAEMNADRDEAIAACEAAKVALQQQLASE